MEKAVKQLRNYMIISAMGAATIFGSGCASLQRVGSGAVKTFDGAARMATGASVGEKAGFYNTTNPNSPNYKAPETYKGKDLKDRVGYTLLVPFKALRQVGEGVGDVLGGVYDGTIGQVTSRTGKIGQATDDLLDPDTKYGFATPAVQNRANQLEEKIGSVKTDDPKRYVLEERNKLLDAVPVVHHFGDEEIPGWRRFFRAVGEVLYFIPSFLGEKSTKAGGKRSGGIAGGKGATGAGIK